MKVVFVVTCLTVGGAQMALYRLLECLSRRIEVHVISLQSGGEVADTIRALGVTVEGLDMEPGVPNPLALAKLGRRLHALSPDLIQTWMYHADLVGGVAASLIRTGAPVVWCVHHSNLSREMNKRSTLMVVKACAFLSRVLPERIIFCSHEARDVHLRAGYAAVKSVVIPNGIDLERFAPDSDARGRIRRELRLSDDAPLVGLAARFDRIKNHEGFIQSAAMLLAAMPTCHFVLAGAGVDGDNHQLMEWIRKAGIGSHVHLLGLRHDMPSLLASLDVLAQTSWGEALPTAVMEAMACGVPCVVTDVGDSALIVGINGRVVPTGDNAGMARHLESMLRLSSEERTQIGKRVRARIQEEYGIATMGRAYESLYQELSGAPHALNS